MAIHRPNFHVLTGGSGSGKSTIVAALAKRGHTSVAEVGRLIVQEQVRCGGDATPWRDRLRFRDLLLARSIAAFERVTERERPVFFDRGIAEAIGYSRVLGAAVPESFWDAARTYRYAPIVFVTPPWRAIYAPDGERKQSWDEALADYRANVDAYVECGYRLVDVPKATVEVRLDYILGQIGEAG